jgi:multiple sugar transport system ATP-binding protein
MAEVHIRKVRKSYGDVSIIREVDIEIPDGQFVVLVGPSGCGKSTLLRMIAGLEEVTSGEIWVGSRLVNNVPAKDRDVAMVFQNYALYPHLSVADNLAFSLRLRRVKAPVIKATVTRASEILGLASLLDRYPRQLSGGQRQRVAMGRAIVRDPQVFLFDEPLSNLDAKLRATMRTEIKELQQRLKTTTIYVTHDQIEAMTMANQIVVMRDGCVEQTGTPLELYDRPVNRFVAGFIGLPAMNFFAAEITNGGLRLPFGITLPFTSNVACTSTPLVFGIRPEHLQIAGPDVAGAIRGTVAVVEPTGSETTVIVECEGGRLTALIRERVNFTPGEALQLKPVPGCGHVFDAHGLRVAEA